NRYRSSKREELTQKLNECHAYGVVSQIFERKGLSGNRDCQYSSRATERCGQSEDRRLAKPLQAINQGRHANRLLCAAAIRSCDAGGPWVNALPPCRSR